MTALAQPTAVEWAKSNGIPFTWSAQLDNHDPPGEGATGIGWSYWGWPTARERPGLPQGGVVIPYARRFTNAKESLYLLQDRALSFKAYRVAGWVAELDTMILHRINRDDHIGPRRMYHLVVNQ